MNRKQFTLLMVFAALIGTAGLMVYRGDHGSWQGGEDALGQKLLPGLAINDIAQINIESGTNTLHLVRRDNLWRVQERGDYPANFSQISDLLVKLADLKIIQNEEIGPSQLGRFELLPPGSAAGGGTLIEFKDQNGQSLGSLLLGKKHLKQPAANASPEGMDGGSWPDGRYVMAGTAAKTVAVISDPLESVVSQPEQWLDKDFLSIANPGAITAAFPEATNSWKLTRTSPTNDWQLADAKAGEKLDATKITDVTTPFSSVSFNDVAPLSGNPNFAGQTSNTMLTVETFDGLTYLARIGAKQDDSYPVSFTITTNSSAGTGTTTQLAKDQPYTNWIYYLPSYSLDEILKPRSQLLVTATNTVPPAAASGK